MAKRPEKVHYIPPQRRKAGPLGPASAASPALPAARHISPTAPAAAQPAHHRSPRFDPVSVVPASPAPAPAPAPASTQRTPRSDSLVPSSPHPPHDAMVGQSATFKVARGDMSFYTGGKQALKESSFMKLASQGKYGKPPSYVNSHVETLEVIETRRAKPAHRIMKATEGPDRQAAVSYPAHPPIRILRRESHEHSSQEHEARHRREHREHSSQEHDARHHRPSREHSEELEARPFNLGPRPEPKRSGPQQATFQAAQYVGDQIGSLQPHTTLEERIMRFVSSLHPDYPDPPPTVPVFEHPKTIGVDAPDPNTPKYDAIDDSRPTWMPAGIAPPTGYWSQLGPSDREHRDQLRDDRERRELREKERIARIRHPKRRPERRNRSPSPLPAPPQMHIVRRPQPSKPTDPWGDVSARVPAEQVKRSLYRIQT